MVETYMRFCITFLFFSFQATSKDRFGILLDNMVVASRVDEENVCIQKCFVFLVHLVCLMLETFLA